MSLSATSFKEDAEGELSIDEYLAEEVFKGGLDPADEFPLVFDKEKRV